MSSGPAGVALLLLVTLAACAEPSVPSADPSKAPFTGTLVPEPTPSPPATDGSIYFAAECGQGDD